MSNTEHILIVSSVWPEPDSSAAGGRMLQLIRLLKSSGREVTYASTAAESAHAVELEAHGVEQAAVKMNSRTFDDFVTELQPSIVVFDRFPAEEQFGWRVAEQCPRALRILDTEDLHCLRLARERAVSEERLFTQDDLLRSTTARREIASILRCDLSLIISEHEIKLLRDVFDVDDSLLHYVPFMLDELDVDDDVKSWPMFENRQHFVTIGNFRHPPNRDSMQYLHDAVWPLVRKQLPNVALHIYGAYPDQQVLDMNRPETGFLVKGRAKDSHKVVSQARVCLAPLRFGAGLKGKLVEAMRCGAPSVTTSIGAEGIAGEMNWSGAVAEDPQALADAAVRLYTDKAAWQEAQSQGVKIINERFRKGVHAPKLIARLAELEGELEHHRLQNFTGGMLMHHTAASTKYMARWIEAKNR